MCRMLAVVSRGAVKADWIRPFSDLSVRGKTRSDMPEPGHHDGWGLAAYPQPFSPEYFGREPHSVMRDIRRYEDNAAKIERSESKIAIAHFRKISVGKPEVSNTHPFLYKEWSFCHNGTIYDSDEIPLKKLKPRGSTDSERFFLYLMERLDAKNFDGSILKSIGAIQKKFKYSSLTFLLSDGNKVYAYRDCDPQFEDYYTLYTADLGGSRAVCSEPLTQIAEHWEAVPIKTLLALTV